MLNPGNWPPVATRRGHVFENRFERAGVIRHRAKARRGEFILGIDNDQGVIHLSTLAGRDDRTKIAIRLIGRTDTRKPGSRIRMPMGSTQRKKAGAALDATSLPGLEIRLLRAFVALVDRRRVTAAAESLGLAQSTVSEALATLERVLGAPLMLRRRGGHGLELAEAGRALLPHARKILAAVDDAHVAMAAATSRARATVAIVANESVSSYLLPGILPPLRRRWPNTRFTVSVATCAGVRGGVAGGRFDLGLLLEEPAESGASRRKAATPEELSDRRVVLSGVTLVLFAGSEHPLVRRGASDVVRHDALSGYPLFMSDAAGDFHDLVRRAFTGDRLNGPVIEATGSIEAVKRAVRADARALGLLPAYAVADELRDSTMVRVNLRPAPPRMRLDALLSQSRARHPSAEELLVAIASIQPALPR